jgi:hypothetical protein
MGDGCSIDKNLSLDSQAFQMFKAGATPLDVSICFNLDSHSTLYLYQNYARLCNLGHLIAIEISLAVSLVFYHYFCAPFYEQNPFIRHNNNTGPKGFDPSTSGSLLNYHIR